MESINKIVETLKQYNEAYRKGRPIVGDQEYDRLVEELRSLDPENPYLHTVEPELPDGRKEVRHPVPMLSIEKAYTREALERFLARVEKEAADIGMETVLFQVIPKLDGLAGRDDGRVFASRGNGEVGYEISSAFEKGVLPVGGRGLGLGEVVVVKSYFDKHLAGKFEHPRNMVVGVVSSDTLNEAAKRALDDGMVRFVPYTELPRWSGSADQLLAEIEEISAELAERTDYPMDGMVVLVMDDGLRTHMGATAHHYRWQIAVKSKGETAVSVVERVTWQVGRTGNVTPVMEIQPVSLSGATIRRVTAHHAGNIRNSGIGAGAEIEIIRSGEVIPKLEKVITPVHEVDIPEACPSCGHPLVWENDFLKCGRLDCPAQNEQRLLHWFRILGTADWFGIKTIQKIVEGGYGSLEKIYAMDEETFLSLGFGPVQSKNLTEAIRVSRTKPVEDWRFLAAFGIPNLGTGESRRLLQHISLADLRKIDAERIEQIHGFGSVTSRAIASGMKAIGSKIGHMLDLGFNLVKTPLLTSQSRVASPIAGKGIVFTGKMQHGTRDAMQAEARALGASVQTSVSGKTDFLVCGENVGAAKLEKAGKTGAQILSEEAYYQLLKGEAPEK